MAVTSHREFRPSVRVASIGDVPAIVEVTNLAYQVEAFFVIGPRTSDALMRDLMARPGTAVLVIDDPTRQGALAASVCLELRGDRGYFGMLAVNPAHQGKGLARTLIDSVEAACRRSGCRHLDIDVINLRSELPAFYARFGFTPMGTAPFDQPERLKQPAHKILMTKRLTD